MTFLIDTNVISEVRKGNRADPTVAAWWSGVAEDDIWLSPLVLGEIRKGVELARRRDPRRAEALESWLAVLTSHFGDRILPFDTAVAEQWGRMSTIRPLPSGRRRAEPVRSLNIHEMAQCCSRWTRMLVSGEVSSSPGLADLETIRPRLHAHH